MKEYKTKKYEFIAQLQKIGLHIEVWKKVDDYPEYEISTEGNIRKTSSHNEIKIRSFSKRAGICARIITDSGSQRKDVAYLVLKTFSKIPPFYNRINHINGNKEDNRLCNLEFQEVVYNPESFKTIPSYPNYSISQNGEIINSKTKKVLKQQKSKNGYLMVSLSDKGKVKSYFVHRLLAETWLQNPDMKPCINHKDGNKANNDILNLEWCTYKENQLHAYDTGLLTIAMKKEYIPWIKKMYAVGIQIKQIADVYDASYDTIWKIITEQTWNH